MDHFLQNREKQRKGVQSMRSSAIRHQKLPSHQKQPLPSPQNKLTFRQNESIPQKIQQRELLRSLSDLELVDQAKAGDRDAFGELVQRYKSKVNSLALKITKNENDAQEVVQDVFLNVFCKLDSFKGTAAFSSWLYRVASNTALMLLRSRKRESHDSWG